VTTMMIPIPTPPPHLVDSHTNCDNVMILDEEKDEYCGQYGSTKYNFSNQPSVKHQQQYQQKERDTNASINGIGNSNESSTLTLQRRDSLPSSTRYDNSIDMSMEHSTQEADDLMASNFLNPNRFHVGYKCNNNHDMVKYNMDNHNHNTSTRIDTNPTSAHSVSKHQTPPLISRHIPKWNGYWNNRNYITNNHDDDDDDDDDDDAMVKNNNHSSSLQYSNTMISEMESKLSSHGNNHNDCNDDNVDDMDVSYN
jgi:hypothetical protein